MLFFSNIETKSFSIIDIFSKNLSKSLFFFNVSSFLIAIFALWRLSSIAKLSFAKLNEPNSKASFISLSNLLLWFSISASDLSSFSSVSFSFSSIVFSLISSLVSPLGTSFFTSILSALFAAKHFYYYLHSFEMLYSKELKNY